MLLRRGARPEINNKHGLSAVDLAEVGSDVRDIIVKAQLKRGRQRPGSSIDRGGLSLSRPIDRSSFVANTTAHAASHHQQESSMDDLKEQVIDRHYGFSGVPSWQRIEKIDSRL